MRRTILTGLVIVATSLFSVSQLNAQPTPPQLALTPVVPTGLEGPLYVTHAPGDATRIFILEQVGRIRIFDLESNVLLPTPFLDLTGVVKAGGEQGLLGLAFHPEYAANGRFFVHYSAPGGGNSGQGVVAEFAVSDDPNVGNPTVVKTLIALADPYPNHNGGWIDFGPDGYLYVAIGDGGGGGDPLNAGQNIGTKFGKILRLDVDAAPPYAPATNPFVGLPNGDPTVWAYGLRNPWRCSFDRATGDLWIGDVGQNAEEEINVQSVFSAGGENYGWNTTEGFSCYAPPNNCDVTDLTDPVHAYTHDDGCSVTGGYVYRGCAIPELQGVYVFADYCAADIRLLYQPGFVMVPSGVDLGSGVTSFGEDAAGEIYVCQSGAVYKLVTLTPPPDADADGVPDSCESPKEGDVNGDDLVNGADLGLLLSGWGPCNNCPRASCGADFNADCAVDGSDLGVLLSNWTG